METLNHLASQSLDGSPDCEIAPVSESTIYDDDWRQIEKRLRERWTGRGLLCVENTDMNLSFAGACLHNCHGSSQSTLCLGDLSWAERARRNRGLLVVKLLRVAVRGLPVMPTSALRSETCLRHCPKSGQRQPQPLLIILSPVPAHSLRPPPYLDRLPS